MSMSLRPTFFNLCLKSQVDSDSQEWAFWHTSASLQFLLRVKVLSERLVTFKGTHGGIITWPIMISRGIDLEEVAYTTTLLPRDMGVLLGSLP